MSDQRQLGRAFRGTMSNVPFTQRLGAFKQRFQQVLGNRGTGYDELAQLEQPLVGDDTNYGGGDNYEQSHGVSRPAQYSGYSGMGGGGGAPPSSALTSQVAQTIPSQVGPVVSPLQALHPEILCMLRLGTEPSLRALSFLGFPQLVALVSSQRSCCRGTSCSC